MQTKQEHTNAAAGAAGRKAERAVADRGPPHPIPPCPALYSKVSSPVSPGGSWPVCRRRR